MDRRHIQVSKAEINLIKSLRHKKTRQEQRLFVAEGSRLVLDIMKSKPSEVRLVVGTEEWITGQVANLSHFLDLTRQISSSQLQAVSSLKSTEEVLALVQFPYFGPGHPRITNFGLYLDGLSDPGNLGTLIRTADWFGIPEIMVSDHVVDWYNSKVVQASMSSISRLKISCVPPEEIRTYSGISRLVGADLVGKPLWPKSGIWEPAVLCLGNEARGLSDRVKMICDEFWTIPSYSLGAESLNVAVAASIFMAGWRSSIL